MSGETGVCDRLRLIGLSQSGHSEQEDAASDSEGEGEGGQKDEVGSKGEESCRGEHVEELFRCL